MPQRSLPQRLGRLMLRHRPVQNIRPGRLFLRIRRIILPLLVFGKPGTNSNSIGCRDGAYFPFGLGLEEASTTSKAFASPDVV